MVLWLCQDDKNAVLAASTALKGKKKVDISLSKKLRWQINKQK